MIHLLAIDTTTDLCSVAVLAESPPPAGSEAGRSCLEHTRLAPRLHSQIVLGMVDDLLRAAAVSRQDVRWVAFGGGPGSFTGVRIGAAVAQGFAFGVGARVIALPSAAATAEVARLRTGWRGEYSVSRPSRPGWRYTARYALREDGCECLAFDQLVSEQQAAADILGERFPSTASTVAQLAWRQRQQAVAPALAQPFYVDGDSPWRPSA